jgi:hypothetical protein
VRGFKLADQQAKSFLLYASLSYAVTENITLTLEGSNLTGAAIYHYGNDKYQPREIDYYGRRYTACVRAKF